MRFPVSPWAAGLVVAGATLLAGCIPARWPAQPAGRPTPLPPVAARPRPPATMPAPTPRLVVPVAPTASPPPAPSAGNPPFYEVFGERYFVLPSSDGYREQGVASWYGAPFHGRRTSSGAIYDMYDFTAAHKTLPLPSRVRVTSLETGRSVVVTVNDRGPFVKDRLIDVSYAAAKELGLVQSGTGAVEIEALTSESGAVAGAVEPALAPAQRLFLQVGAFSDEVNAARLKTTLEANGVNNVVIRYDDTANPAMYRVRIGPIEGSGAYDALASQVASLNIANPRLVTESPVRRGSPPGP